MQSLLDQIPGYREAVESERAARQWAFIDAPEFVCGVEVLPLSQLAVLRLQAVKSPFIIGGFPSPIDVGLFLWIVSPDYGRAIRVRDTVEPWFRWLAKWLFNRTRRRFLSGIKRLEYQKGVEAIRAYVTAAYADAPAGSGAMGASYYSGTAALVESLAHAYHWTEDALLHMPLKRVWQYGRRLEERHTQRPIFFNPSDKVRGRWLAEQSRN